MYHLDLLKWVQIIQDISLDNMKENDGELRINCSITFYNQLTDEYNEITKIKKYFKN